MLKNVCSSCLFGKPLLTPSMTSWWVMRLVTLLYTPNEDYKSAPKDFVNVLEDARIERMMKVTYPGLRKSFFVGYRELWEHDFFGVKNDDPNTLSLIDRINLYFKGNPNIPFADEEMVWVNRAEKTKTFKMLLILLKSCMSSAQEKQENKEDMKLLQTCPDLLTIS